ncbi:MAG: putative PEP-binding protein, partial [Burkholderiaceae bacterium]
LHPAVLQLLSMTISAGAKAGVPVAVCGEIAGDTTLPRPLLGIGLRAFSMHPAQLLAVKQEVLNSDLGLIEPAAKKVLKVYEPSAIAEAMEKLGKL